MALATSSWKPMYSFQSEDITCPACNGKHRPHTNKEGLQEIQGSEPKPAQVPKRPSLILRKLSRRVIQPDSKLDVPAQPFHLMKSQWWPLDQVPVQGTVSQDVGTSRLKKEPEVKPEPKVEVKLEEKKEPSPKGTLSLALQRIHDKLQSPTELLKLHLKHYSYDY